MSLVLTSLLVAGGVMVGRWIMKSSMPKSDEEADVAKRGAAQDSDPTNKAPAPDPLASFPCRLGDVVIRLGSGEAWLAGALVFFEEVPTAALFIAPDAGGDRALFVRPSPSTTMTWLDPLQKDEILTGSEPPTSLEHRGLRFERTRRLPVRVERVGTGAPDVGERVIVAEYAAQNGERLLVIVGGGQARAWRGMALEQGMYDVLPGA